MFDGKLLNTHSPTRPHANVSPLLGPLPAFVAVFLLFEVVKTRTLGQASASAFLTMIPDLVRTFRFPLPPP